MASLSIRGCADHHTLLGKSSFFSQNARKSSSLTIPSRPKCLKISMAASTTTMNSRSFTKLSSLQLYAQNQEETNKEAVPYEKLDEWLRDTVVEIVKNLPETPLLVHVYGGDDGGTASCQAQKAMAEEWDVIKGKWENKESPLPEGIIFVEELKGHVEDDITKAWGIVVQGKGGQYGPTSCYLLKTSRVVGSGLGLCCTHFCLMKVRDFREVAESQLKNCWLL